MTKCIGACLFASYFLGHHHVTLRLFLFMKAMGEVCLLCIAGGWFPPQCMYHGQGCLGPAHLDTYANALAECDEEKPPSVLSCKNIVAAMARYLTFVRRPLCKCTHERHSSKIQREIKPARMAATFCTK